MLPPPLQLECVKDFFYQAVRSFLDYIECPCVLIAHIGVKIYSVKISDIIAVVIFARLFVFERAIA